ncbi:MAG: dethiobiotin synthase, partial [Nitrospirae bacterium]
MISQGYGIFITGTDTGVGKTFVSRGIIKSLKRRGVSVGAMKPVETGCIKRNGELIPADAIELKRASNMKEPIEIINPFSYEMPLSPYAASMYEEIKIKKDKILDVFHMLKKRYDFVIVEGAGGLMVPLSRDYMIADLIIHMELPIIIVAKAGLGTLNHTILTIKVAKLYGIEVKGVVLNHTSSHSDISEETNPMIIEELCNI